MAGPAGTGPAGVSPTQVLGDPAGAGASGLPERRGAVDVVSVRSVAELASLGVDQRPDVVLLELPARQVEAELSRINDLARRCGVLVLSTSQSTQDMVATLLDCVRSGPETLRHPAEPAGGEESGSDQAVVVGEGDGSVVLTARESEALRYLAAGYTHAQAATRMGISIWTFETYLRRVRSKYGVANTAGLIRLALSLERAQPSCVQSDTG